MDAQVVQERLTIENMRAWVARHPRRRYFGYGGDAKHCPIAEFLDEEFPELEVEYVYESGAGLHNAEYIRLSYYREWPMYFITLVDKYHNRTGAWGARPTKTLSRVPREKLLAYLEEAEQLVELAKATPA